MSNDFRTTNQIMLALALRAVGGAGREWYAAAVAQFVNDVTGSYAPMKGTIYYTARTLHKRGWITISRINNRVYYRLTKKGETALESMRTELTSMTRTRGGRSRGLVEVERRKTSTR